MGYPTGSAHEQVAPRSCRSGKKIGGGRVSTGGYDALGAALGHGSRGERNELLRRWFLRADGSRAPKNSSGCRRSAESRGITEGMRTPRWQHPQQTGPDEVLDVLLPRE